MQKAAYLRAFCLLIYTRLLTRVMRQRHIEISYAREQYKERAIDGSRQFISIIPLGKPTQPSLLCDKKATAAEDVKGDKFEVAVLLARLLQLLLLLTGYTYTHKYQGGGGGDDKKKTAWWRSFHPIQVVVAGFGMAWWATCRRKSISTDENFARLLLI